MEEVVGVPQSFGGAFAGRRVLVTGHTGFKGAWLSLWLTHLGADVHGFALEPPSDPSLFECAGVAERMASHRIGDIRDADALASCFADVRPDVVLHLAAQPLVRDSYTDPVGTYGTNVMGTVNVLEAVRACPSVSAVVSVTSDKCYENREWEYAYRENDAMGGFDPYSSSKGCAELVTAAYRRSFFGSQGSARIASARAGNVVGGGDWARDRIVPDCVRALTCGETVVLRNPDAVRPWQHVLEPLAGYLTLAAALLDEKPVDDAWNFGPDPDGGVPVRDIVEQMLSAWGSGAWALDPDAAAQPHEARLLRLDSTKARTHLGWRPVWDIAATVAKTAAWYGAWHRDSQAAHELCLADIADYTADAAATGAAWAQHEEGTE